MAYSPENNPYIPGDPASYDLSWVVERLNKHKFAEESAADAKIQADRAKGQADRAENEADRAENEAGQAAGFAGDAQNAANSVQPQIDDQNSKIAVLEGRMDAFSTLPEGSTTGDAELMDIRTADDGIVYPNAGDAVRGQVHQITDFMLGVDETFTHNGSAAYEYWPCLLLPGVKYTVTAPGSVHIAAVRIYKIDNSYIAVGSIAVDGSIQFIVPSAEYVRIGAYLYNGKSIHVTNEFAALTNARDYYNKLAVLQELSYKLVLDKTIGAVDGAEYSNYDYQATDFIPVTPGEVYSFTGVIGGSSLSNATGVAGYNNLQVYAADLVDRLKATGAWGSGRVLVTDFRFQIPAGVYYIRGCSSEDGTPNSPVIINRVNMDGLGYAVEEIQKNGDQIAACLAQLSEYNSYVSGYDPNPVVEKKCFTIGVTSDIHGADKQWQDFIRTNNKYQKFIDCAINLGDIVGANPNSDLSFYVPDDSDVPLLSVIGNHDIAQNNNVGIDPATAFTKYIQPLVTAGFISASENYYYKDFAQYKIRVISLFEYEGATTTASAVTDDFYRFMTTTQLQWFANTLYDTPTDYSVIVLLHQIMYYYPEIINNKFTIEPQYRKVNAAFNGGYGYLFNKMNGDCISDIVNAFIHSGSISRSYVQTIHGVSRTSTVTKDFSTRGVNGNFICYLGGHSHAPFIVADGTYTDQLQVLLPSGSDSPYQRANGDIMPIKNIPNYYCMSFDTTNKLIKIYKAGYQVTKGMTDRDYISMPY